MPLRNEVRLNVIKQRRMLLNVKDFNFTRHFVKGESVNRRFNESLQFLKVPCSLGQKTFCTLIVIFSISSRIIIQIYTICFKIKLKVQHDYQVITVIK